MRKTMSAPSSFCPITIRPLCNRCALEPSTYSWSSYGAKTSEWIAFMHFLIKSHLEPSVTVGKWKYVCLCIWPILQQVVIESLNLTNIQIPSSCLMPNIWNIVQSCTMTLLKVSKVTLQEFDQLYPTFVHSVLHSFEAKKGGHWIPKKEFPMF